MTAEDDFRQHLQKLVAIVRPYAYASGLYHDIGDVKVMLSMAEGEIERARHLVDRLQQGNGQR
jgi:hypothetical protein